MKTPEYLARLPLAVAAALSLGAVSAFAQPASDDSPAKHPHATLSLVSASQSWHPGTPLLLAFNLDIEEGWHTYWRGISDTGQPPVFNLTLPEGFVAQPAVWPAPHREISTFVDALDHIYEHHLTVVVPVQTPAPGSPGAAAKSARFKASGVWLVCKNACVPEKGESSLELPQGAGDDASTFASRITSTLAQAGRPWSEAPSGASINHTLAGEAATCTITVPGATWLAFYPDQHCLPMPSLFKEGEAKGSALRLTLAPKDDPQATRVTGLLEVRGLGEKPQFFSVDELVIGSVPSGAAPPPESPR